MNQGKPTKIGIKKIFQPKTFTGAVIGGLVGAAALLLAPKAGKDSK